MNKATPVILCPDGGFSGENVNLDILLEQLVLEAYEIYRTRSNETG